MSGKSWFVLHCDSDDSHVLVESTSVICDESVKVGDDVQFSYPGIKNLLHGTVRGMADDYDAMRKLLNTLNSSTKPRRVRSFHEDEPRLAARKCKEKGFGYSKKPQSSASKSSKIEKTQSGAKSRKRPQRNSSKKRSVLQEVLEEVNDSLSSSSSSPSDDEPLAMLKGQKRLKADNKGQSKTLSQASDKSDSETDNETVTEEEMKVLAKLSKMKKYKDLQSLLEISKIGTQRPSRSENLVVSASAPPKKGDEAQVSEKDSGKHEASKSNGSAPPSGSSAEAAFKYSDKKGIPVQMKSAVKDIPTSNFVPDDEIDCSEFDLACSGKRTSTEPVIDSGIFSKRMKAAETSHSNNSSTGVIDFDDVCDIEISAGTSFIEHGNEQDATTNNDSPERPKEKEKQDQVKDLASHQQEGTGRDALKQKEVQVEELGSKPTVMNLREWVARGRKPPAFMGDFYRVKKEDANAVQLTGGEEIYVTKKALHQAKKCLTPTAMARYLLKQVFSDAALLACSVAGKPKTKDGIVTVRPALSDEGISAIIDFTKARCRKKGLPEPNDTHLKSNMGSVLSDERKRGKKDENSD